MYQMNINLDSYKKGKCNNERTSFKLILKDGPPGDAVDLENIGYDLAGNLFELSDGVI